MSDQIEFYKSRSIGERLSATIDFLKQNWKVLYKNILIGGLPLAIIMGFLLNGLQSNRSILADTFPNLTGFSFYYAIP